MQLIKRQFSLRKRRSHRSSIQEKFENALVNGNATLVQNMLINCREEIDLNALNSQGVSALHQCVLLNNMTLLRVLLNFDADVNTPDKHGWTSLHAASALGYENTVQILLVKGIDYNARTTTGESAVDMSISPQITRIIRRHSRRVRLLSRDSTFDSNGSSCSSSSSSVQSRSSRASNYLY